MSIDTLLKDMDTIVEEGKVVPFSNKQMVDAAELKRLIEDARLNMPNEITQAKKIAAERRDILNAAEAEAERILAKAREKADLMIEEHQITKEAREAARGIMQQAKNESETLVSNARANASDIMDKAEKWSDDMRRNASNYVETIIRDTDETLTKSVNDVRQLRQSVREALSRNRDSRPNFD